MLFSVSARLCLAFTLAICSIAAGCGGSSGRSAAPITGSAHEQIAATVNAMFGAWKAGDGKTACSLLTQRGRTALVSLARRFSHTNATSCEDAVAASAGDVHQPAGPPASPSDASITGPSTAQLNSQFGTAVLLRRVQGIWLIEVPAFIN